MAQAGGVGLHQVGHGLQCVRHIHHIHIAVLGDFAGVVMALLDNLVEDLHGIVGRAAAGHRTVGDDAGETDAARIDSEAREIVIAQQLAGHLAAAVDRIGAHNGILRGAVVRSARAECSDRTGRKYRAAELLRDVEGVEQRAHIDTPGHLRHLFAGRAEQCHKIENGIDLMLFDGFCKCICIRCVKLFGDAKL